MGLIKRNIWSLFYIILAIGAIVLSMISYFTWISNYNQFKQQHENIVKIIFNSTNSFFDQQEFMLDILINQLDKEDIFANKKTIQKNFDNLIKMSDTVVGFGLAKPNGDLVDLSSNINTKKLPNLLMQKQSGNSFLKALKSKKMIIGRTYFFTPLNKLILPVRKAIRDAKGEVVAVLNVAIAIDKGAGFPKQNILMSPSHNIVIVKENRYRILLLAKSKISVEKLYKKSASKRLFRLITKIVEQKYKQLIKSIKEKEKLVTVSYFSPFAGAKVLSSFKYNKKYNFFVLSQTTLETVNKKFYILLSIYLAIYIFTFLILYLLFNYIANFEKYQKRILYRQATHDSLTGLPNRLFLSDNMSIWINEKQKCFSLFFIDMDNFKHINDTYGNKFGDKTLKEISRRLKEIILENDLVVHHGGDEFLVMVKTSDKKKIMSFAQKILDALNVPYSEKGKHVILRASIGISTYPKDGKTIDDLMRCADASMLEAKKKKNQFFIFGDSIKNKYLRDLQVEHELRFALLHDEIYMAYQPQINADGSIYGVEALVRWENEKLGNIPPDEFISAAEKSGMIRDIGRFIIKTSLTQIRDLQESLKQEFQLSINISLMQFMEEDFLDSLMDMIKNSKFPQKNITLEITENLFIEEFDYVKDLLKALRQKNIKISLDDFGTGYSSLSLLKQLPINELKIDKIFVDDILENKISKNMVQSILNIGKNFGIHVVVEGVEIKEQVSMMKSLTCKTFQGYYFAKPMIKKYLYDFCKKI